MVSLAEKTPPLPLRSADGRVGYVRRNGEWCIAPRFDFGARFAHGRALVRINGRYGFIDEAGAQCIDCQFAGATWFCDGLSCVTDAEGVHRFIDVDGRALPGEPIDAPALFREGHAVVKRSGRVYVLGRDGRPVFERTFEFARHVSEGLLAAFDDGQWQYVSLDGATVLRVAGAADSFSDGRAAVRGGAGFHYLDRAGHVAIAGPFSSAAVFSDGRGLVQRAGRFGYVDVEGREAVEARYARAERFSEGVAWVWVKSDGLAQAIDREGRVRAEAPAPGALVAPFLEGAALVLSADPRTRASSEAYVFSDGTWLRPASPGT